MRMKYASTTNYNRGHLFDVINILRESSYSVEASNDIQMNITLTVHLQIGCTYMYIIV